MTVVNSVKLQMLKAEFAETWTEYMQQFSCLDSLFSGGTDRATTSHIIAGLVGFRSELLVVGEGLSTEQSVEVLFECFQLLAVKFAQKKELSHPEKIILKLCQLLCQEFQQDAYASELSQAAIDKRDKLVEVGKHLSTVERREQVKARNMGKF
ncbi:hypothetical protein [Paraferrimonas sedimenticola]|uniref:Uncharacterized protein n=1 Tax=Paraferrimonas sedimenticola TaxID=375674 RepID=A0AA37RXB7_9GAMM|nr:hypothetical protein [Paraferrimonas sedimenticola]GLP97068.1 hypothetical protein GCM10007895_23740 [Paraferrimonas sedimenticola]